MIEKIFAIWYGAVMKPKIFYEVSEFLQRHGLPVVRLTMEAGLSPSTLSRVLQGKRKDMVSASADALRDAMQRLEAEIDAAAKAGSPDA